MNTTRTSSQSKVLRGSHDSFAIQQAHVLADMGAPVFLSRLTPDGEPILPQEWQKSPAGEASHRAITRWQPGRRMALCAVTGVAFDVIDYDPRNDPGGSFQRLVTELGEEGLEYIWRVATPSGGQHFYVPRHEAGTHCPIGPDWRGIDLKAEGGFVWLPPTVRPSKTTGELTAYRTDMQIEQMNGHRPSARLIEIVSSRGGTGRSGDGEAGPGRSHAELSEQAATAEPGEQHFGLRDYAFDLARLGITEDEALTLLRAKAAGLRLRGPAWSDTVLLGLYRSADVKVIGNARGSEATLLDEISSAEPHRKGLVLSFSDVQEEDVSWLWEGYLAFGYMTLLDGEKGQGKSFITTDVSARASRGRAMPGAVTAVADPVSVLLLGTEDRASEQRKRLRAAGADLLRVNRPAIARRRGGKAPDMYLLPDAAPRIGAMIRECGAGLVVLDPIADFLDETVNSHSDASVRRALAPLAVELEKAGCAGLALRHMNKDTRQDAKFRGTGSSAFQNRGRVHLIAARMPVSYPGLGDYGLAMVDNNLIRNESLVLTYSIVDSDIRLDAHGNMVGLIEWYETAPDMDANDLTRPDPVRRGPEPTARNEVVEVLSAMFEERSVWPKTEAEAELRAAGVSTNNKVIAAAKAEAGVRSEQREGGWVWTTEKRRIRRNG